MSCTCGKALCLYCFGVELLVLPRQGRADPLWRGCPCCGCIWNGRIEPSNQANPLSWIPACLHTVPMT